MASAYPRLQAERSAAGSADGKREASACTRARSTGEAPDAWRAASVTAPKARETDAVRSAGSKASHGLL